MALTHALQCLAAFNASLFGMVCLVHLIDKSVKQYPADSHSFVLLPGTAVDLNFQLMVRRYPLRRIFLFRVGSSTNMHFCLEDREDSRWVTHTKDAHGRTMFVHAGTHFFLLTQHKVPSIKHCTHKQRQHFYRHTHPTPTRFRPAYLCYDEWSCRFQAGTRLHSDE